MCTPPALSRQESALPVIDCTGSFYKQAVNIKSRPGAIVHWKTIPPGDSCRQRGFETFTFFKHVDPVQLPPIIRIVRVDRLGKGNVHCVISSSEIVYGKQEEPGNFVHYP